MTDSWEKLSWKFEKLRQKGWVEDIGHKFIII